MSAKHVHLLRRSVFPLALLGCLLLSACSGSSPVQSAPTREAAKLQPLLLARMQQLRIPGAIVYVDDPGQGSWITALGMGNLATREPMQANNYMRVGSIAKTFTATVILQLVDQHKLGLDDPVSKYRPEVPNGAHITIRELLNMSSGLYTYDDDEGYVQTSLAEPYKVWQPQELLAIAFKHPPVFAPGKGYLYDNTNYILLGLIMQQLTHLPAEQAWQRYLFGPLGMHQTSLASPTSSAIPDPHAQGYMYGTDFTGTGPLFNVTDRNFSWAWTAGGAISTLHDLKIWVKALATGQLLSADTQQQRLSSWNNTGLSWLGKPWLYGLGVINYAGFLGHSGVLFGFNSWMGYQPQTGATIIVLAGCSPSTTSSPASGNSGAKPARSFAGLVGTGRGRKRARNEL
jgi:D-alanyl-D-alanine carboxypeptidase